MTMTTEELSARYDMGEKYLSSNDEKEQRRGVEIIGELAIEGYTPAQTELGYLYRNGWHVPKNSQKALRWLKKAIEQGDAGAQDNLGVMYAAGEGVEQSYEKAVEWYRKAADQGNAAAQNHLGVCYQNGKGVKQDKKEAAKWYQKAADQGNKDAQKNLKNLSGCFITTAVCQTFHKPDDCYELTMFRHFRDNWLSKQPNGKDMIAEYYVVAPSIVEKIDSSEYPDQVYRKIWKLYLNPCLHYLENRQYEDCRNLYVEMVTKLKKKCKVDVE